MDETELRMLGSRDIWKKEKETVMVGLVFIKEFYRIWILNVIYKLFIIQNSHPVITFHFLFHVDLF